MKEVQRIMRDQNLLEKYKRLLPQQQGIQHLIESIALAEKSFTVLVCEDQTLPEGDLTGAEYQARAALQALVKQMAARRDEPLLLLHFAFKKKDPNLLPLRGLSPRSLNRSIIGRDWMIMSPLIRKIFRRVIKRTVFCPSI